MSSQPQLRLLLIEDSLDDADLLLRRLKREGYDVDSLRIETEEEMRRAFAEREWDLVIADHNLPRFSSSAALEIYNELGLDLPFLIVSGSIDEADAVAAMRAGAHDYILKHRLGRLLPAIARELREAQERQARREAEKRLMQQARKDTLTGFLNRREFERRVRQSLVLARREREEHVLGFLDVDRFRLVNEVCGQSAGDELLRQVTEEISDQVRGSDALARLGGDEIGLLLFDCSLEKGQALVGGVLDKIRELPFQWLDHRFEITASVGLTRVDADSESATRVLQEAVLACQGAKVQGGGRLRIFEPGDEDLTQRRDEILWVGRLLKALEENRFELWTQKIAAVRGANGSLPHYEVLLRLLGEDGRIVLPGEFIPAAERNNLMPTLDRWVVQRAIRMLENGEAPPGHYMVNLSGHSLSEASFQDFVADRLENRQFDGFSLGFEVTETAAIQQLGQAASFVRRLKELGCRIALDDFGSGLSSFAYLKQLPVDSLKIDGSYIRAMLEDEIALAIVDAIQRIGRALDLETVAEFVETEDHLEAVRRLGIDFAQGYAIHRPESLVRGA